MSVPPAVIVSTLRAAGCVFAEDEALLLIDAAETSDELDALIARRVAGLPLELVLGWAQFCDLRIVLEPGVFVPRRRTEFLAAQAARVAGFVPAGAVVVDLCCGSGAVAAAVVAAGDVAELHAVDIDPLAVSCARRNVADGLVYEGDLYDPLPARLRGRIDVLVANAPYVPTEAVALLPREARIYESRIALDGGTDGLDVQRRVAGQAMEWLAPAGYLLIETSQAQASRTAAAFVAGGLHPTVITSAEFDATVVIGGRSPAQTLDVDIASATSSTERSLASVEESW